HFPAEGSEVIGPSGRYRIWTWTSGPMNVYVPHWGQGSKRPKSSIEAAPAPNAVSPSDEPALAPTEPPGPTEPPAPTEPTAPPPM
ncbi:MAG TPA: hypothetical protein PLF40_31255, partial [Kofleriaceae bacterium]|nr:hypothetical protein [Kofleriaceae bacterium]